MPSQISFYAVATGKEVGVFNNWAECEESVRGFKGAVYKKFKTRSEAEEFIASNPTSQTKSPKGPAVLCLSKTAEQVKALEEEFKPDYYVYTDGACSNNGQEGAKAGIGVWFGEDDPRNISRTIEGTQTNNAAELQAILTVSEIIHRDLEAGKRVAIVSDSEYAIRCVTSYGAKCAEANWAKEIPNKDLVRSCYEAYEGNPSVQFLHVMAHTEFTDRHSVGNAGADKLANKAIGLEGCPYGGGGAAVSADNMYLNVSFAKKDEAKALGAKWDANKRKWYVHNGAAGYEELVGRFGD
jgi:ribonuclease HI